MSLPSIGANGIFLLKETSVVGAIAVVDLMNITKDLIGMYYQTSEALLMLVAVYLIMINEHAASDGRGGIFGFRRRLEGSYRGRLTRAYWSAAVTPIPVRWRQLKSEGKFGLVSLVINIPLVMSIKMAKCRGLMYMNVSLGIVSPDRAPITAVEQLRGKKVIVAKGTTAETYLTKNYQDIEQLKFEQYTEIFEALKDGRGAAIVNDNTEVIAWAKQNPGFSVGVPSLGGQDTIAPAIKKGNKELLDWINHELAALGEENFIHQAYDANKGFFGNWRK